ncbi:response regulator [Sphingomonas sp. UV9]|uniref:response regulator n=1 Tax=Sphingomonas sp. UV9 TaxID=1851410 RepID=UPI000FFC6B53|nr:response regulator [Sphingomonas sp. UV9]RXD05243.1 response regulator [Sphingomonas sp. UV9]
MHAIPKSVVLVVDDDPLVRVHSLFALEDAGYEVVEAGNAADALACLEERPDIGALFTDIRMPGSLDGVGLANVVHERRPDIAILVTSGLEDGADRALPATANFVRKPYTGAQISRLLAPDDEPVGVAKQADLRPRSPRAGSMSAP